MVKQVITISPEGVISGLQMKKGKGIDLRQFGDAPKIERATEVLPTDDGKRWFVKILTGPMAGWEITADDMCSVADQLDKICINGGYTFADEYPDARVEFDDYDDAVRAEVAVLNEARLHGVF